MATDGPAAAWLPAKVAAHTDAVPAVFAPAALGPLTLRNRIIKAATFEGLSRRGAVTDALIDFHRAFAVGGVGGEVPQGRADRRPRRIDARDQQQPQHADDVRRACGGAVDPGVRDHRD